ncbi:MAG: hypothetical protein K2K21_03400 [Lachnospiraceae bacterium]|nr:hypothetical protein [Lachnospiraceae bacterium]
MWKVLQLYQAACPSAGAVGFIELEHAVRPAVSAGNVLHAMPDGLSVSLDEIQADQPTRELTGSFVDKVIVWLGQKIEIRWKFKK